jgi:hypothetical protein
MADGRAHDRCDPSFIGLFPDLVLGPDAQSWRSMGLQDFDFAPLPVYKS